jgi:hypothetical protein
MFHANGIASSAREIGLLRRRENVSMLESDTALHSATTDPKISSRTTTASRPFEVRRDEDRALAA